MNGVVLYGPQGCGKTKNAKALMNLLGMKHAIDDFVPGDDLEMDTLHLTNSRCNEGFNYSKININRNSDDASKLAINKSLPSLYVEFDPICTTELGKVVRVYVNSNSLVPPDLEVFAAIFSSQKPLIISAMEFITIFEH